MTTQTNRSIEGIHKKLFPDSAAPESNVDSQSGQKNNGDVWVRTKLSGQENGRDLTYSQRVVTDHNQRRCQIYGDVSRPDLVSFLILQSMKAEVVIQVRISAVEMPPHVGFDEPADC